MNFGLSEYLFWHNLVFTPDYPGYVGPGGNDKKQEYAVGEYQYAHIAPKYLAKWTAVGSDIRDAAHEMLWKLRNAAVREAVALGVPPEFLPQMEDGTLRLLRYPPGAAIAEHHDFNLLTLPLWRNIWSNYRRGDDAYDGRSIHYGEIFNLLFPDQKPTTHWTLPHDRWQYSAVYFAMPHLGARLPDGSTVHEWVTGRKYETRK